MLVSCTAFTTPTSTTATMDFPGMLWDVRGVMLKLLLMLMLVCIGITTPTTTTATMDSPGMCLDARDVMLKLPQRLMLMPDIMDSIHDIRHQHQPLGQLQHHVSCVQTHTGGIHSSRSCSRGSDTYTDQHQHQEQLQHHASYVP